MGRAYVMLIAACLLMLGVILAAAIAVDIASYWMP